jgi:nitrite reductase (NO-forming)
MHGTVMVLPRDGKDAEGKALGYDEIFCIGEDDLYLPKDANGRYKTYETVRESFADTTEVMRKLIPPTWSSTAGSTRSPARTR